MHIELNTFQKYSADSKLSTNTYLMSVAAIFQKLYVKVDVTLVSIETFKLHGSTTVGSTTVGST